MIVVEIWEGFLEAQERGRPVAGVLQQVGVVGQLALQPGSSPRS